MGQNINVKSRVDYNKIDGLNFVLPAQAISGTSAVVNPKNGQLTYDNNVCYVYNETKTRWETLGQGALNYRGIVDDTLTTETEYAKKNLPDTPLIGDVWMVASDHEYGPTGEKQYAQTGDMFICVAEKDTTTTPATEAKWTLVPSGNGRYAADITGNGTDASFSFTYGLATSDVAVEVYQKIYDTTDPTKVVSHDKVLVATTIVQADGTTLTKPQVKVDFAVAPVVGENYRLIVMAG